MKMYVFALLSILLYSTTFYTSYHHHQDNQQVSPFAQRQPDNQRSLHTKVASSQNDTSEMSLLPHNKTQQRLVQPRTAISTNDDDDDTFATSNPRTELALSSRHTSDYFRQFNIPATAGGAARTNERQSSRFRTDQAITLSDGTLAIPVAIVHPQKPHPNDIIQIDRRSHTVALPAKARTSLGVAAGLYAFMAVLNGFFLFYEFDNAADQTQQNTTSLHTTHAPYPPNEPSLLKWLNISFLSTATLALLKGLRDSTPAQVTDSYTQYSAEEAAAPTIQRAWRKFKEKQK